MSDEQPLVQKNLATQLKKVIIPKETYSSKKKGTISYVPPEYIIDGYVHSSLSHKSMKKNCFIPAIQQFSGYKLLFLKIISTKNAKTYPPPGAAKGT